MNRNSGFQVFSIGVLLAGLLGIASFGVKTAFAATESASGQILVYKKWIGASGKEADVEIVLNCEGQKGFESRWINRDEPSGWQLTNLPSAGEFCSVIEDERDTFIADTSDCRNLLVLPGQLTECTMVNTKLVKRIEMLNRYGLVIMIAVMLGAGLAATRKFGQM